MVAVMTVALSVGVTSTVFKLSPHMFGVSGA